MNLDVLKLLCPTCKGYDTYFTTDEDMDSSQPVELEGEDEE